jgi:hypothetical protein
VHDRTDLYGAPRGSRVWKQARELDRSFPGLYVDHVVPVDLARLALRELDGQLRIGEQFAADQFTSFVGDSLELVTLQARFTTTLQDQ